MIKNDIEKELKKWKKKNNDKKTDNVLKKLT